MKQYNIRARKAYRYKMRLPMNEHYTLSEAAWRQWWGRETRRGFKEARSQRRTRCLDCRVYTLKIGEYYSVVNEVWNSVASKGMLCIGCLEARLGRQLEPYDFMEAPINYLGPKSQRFMHRFIGLDYV